MALLDRVIFNPSSDGPGDFIVIDAVKGYQTPIAAGAVDGATYPYAAEYRDHAGVIREWEVGIGTWTAATSTLARTTVLFSSNGNSKVNFANVPQVMITALAEDLDFGVVPTTYYVDGTAGNDAHSGDIGHPWKTITKVNSSTFNPGDSVLFAGTQTFSGAIVCPSSGTMGSPITFGSYGTGRATISSGTSTGFTSISNSGITVRDLIFTGSAGSSNRGIFFNFLDSPAGNPHFGFNIINCTISGYGWDGIKFTADNGDFQDVIIRDCEVSNCCLSGSTSSVGGTAGIYTLFGTNIEIANCHVHNCPGVTDTENNGNGIKLGAVENNAVVRNCRVHDNGSGCTLGAGQGGPAGIWCAASNGVIIEQCEVYNTGSGNGEDGNGFDIDLGCTNCIIRDCYAHNNLGAGFLLFNSGGRTWDSGSLINCVSEGDGTGGAAGAISIACDASTTTFTNILIAGCTVYQTQSKAAITVNGATGSTTNISGIVTGNTFAVSGSQNLIFVPFVASNLLFNGNRYNSNTPRASYNGTTYDSMADLIAVVSNIEPNGDINCRNIQAGYMNSLFSAGGNEGGLYISLVTDTQSRAILALDGSDIAALSFGPGGSTAPDVKLTRSGIGSINLIGPSPHHEVYQLNSANAIFKIPNATFNNWFLAAAGNATLSGYGNFGMGENSLVSLTGGLTNVAVGNSAGASITSGNNNTGIGHQSLNLLQGGEGNTAIGLGSGSQLVSGAENTLIGCNVGGVGLTGTENTLIGGRDSLGSSFGTCGGTITSGNQNIVIGAACDVPNAASNGQLSIGNFIYGTSLTGIGSSISAGSIGIGVKAPAVELDVAGRVKTLTYLTTALPAAGNKGARAFVTDSNSATFATTFSSGGTNNVPVYDDGTKWRVG